MAGLGTVALCRSPAASALPARPAASHMSATRVSSFRRRVSISCSIQYGRRGRRRSATLGQRGSTIPASRSPICRRSTSSWSRTPITIILISPRCRDLQPRIARASLRRSATTPSCATAIPRSRPKPTIGTPAWSSAPAAAVTLVPTRHWSARNLSDRNMSLWASFVIEAAVRAHLFRCRFRIWRWPAVPPGARAHRPVQARHSSDRRL